MQNLNDEMSFDELQNKVSFAPLCNGRFTFRTHELKFTANHKKIHIAVSSSARSLLIFSFFAGCIIFVLGNIISEDGRISFANFSIALLLWGIGIFFSVKFIRERQFFDLIEKTFWQNKNKIPFSQIAALQFIENLRYIKGRKYLFYEVNLVLKNCSRIHLLNHYNPEKLEEELRILSRELNLPVWRHDVEKEKREEKYPWFAIFLLLLFGIVFPLVGCYVLSAGVFTPYQSLLRSREWQEVPASIIHSEIIREKDSAPNSIGYVYSVDISAEYHWNNKTFKCSKYDFFLSGLQTGINAWVKEMKQIVEDNPVGRTTVCYVNPQNPSESVLYRGRPLYFTIAVPAFAGFMFFAGGVTMLIIGIVFWKKKKNE